MNVLVLNWLDRENPQAGGAEIHLHETFGRLAAKGWRVVLVSSGWKGAPPRTRLDDIEVHRVGGRLSYPLRAIPRSRRLLKERAFDLVVEDLNKAPLFTPLWTDTPSLLLVHHLFGATAFQEVTPPVAAMTWSLERPLSRVFRGVPTVAVSESTRDDLIERGLPGAQIEVIPNGVDLARFSPGDPSQRFPDPTFIYLGRLRRYKRVDLVLHALRRVRDAGIPARLIVAGKGPHRGALEAEARRLGLGEPELRFAGFVSEEEKLELLRRSWVHILTSPKEGWGIANLEAAASGTPSVASDSPGLRDSVLEGETGFLVAHGDVDAVADRLIRLVEDPALRQAMGARARTFAEGFSWDRTADRMGEALTRAVAAVSRSG